MLYCQHQRNDVKSSQVRILQYFINTYLRYFGLSFYDSRSSINKFCLVNNFSETTHNNFWNWTLYWYGAIQKVCTFWEGRKLVFQSHTKTYKGSKRVIQEGMYAYDFLKSYSHIVSSLFLSLHYSLIQKTVWQCQSFS